MLKIHKDLLLFDDGIKERLDFICKYSNIKPIFHNRNIITIDGTNLYYVEPHRFTISNHLFLFFNYGNEVYYYHCNHKENSYQIANKKLDVEIRKIYDESKKRYGSPKITKVLESGGIKVSQKRNHSFHIWLSDDEYINLKKRSLNSGLSISDIFRLALKGQPV